MRTVADVKGGKEGRLSFEEAQLSANLGQAYGATAGLLEAAESACGTARLCLEERHVRMYQLIIETAKVLDLEIAEKWDQEFKSRKDGC